MPTIFRKKDLHFVMRESPIDAYRWSTTPRLGQSVHARLLNFDIRSLEPGKFSFPYHFHRASEEFFLILSGEISLRTPAGFEKLTEGDMVFFEEGPGSAHQLYNHSDSACVYLDVRAAAGIDVSEYPDTGKVAILPGMELFEGANKSEYYKGEEDVVSKWPQQLIRKG